ncbi:hypothetical protein PG991_013423 [Apiospora marii]|uniref:Lysine-specific metallo-endopeptidase domain-containing protein n=1 Tax=Apiospora marii TaxID=335849 RepID=A0ABR1R6P4_9PEZI
MQLIYYVYLITLVAAAGPQPPLLPRLVPYVLPPLNILPEPAGFSQNISIRADDGDDHGLPNVIFQPLPGYQWDQDVTGDEYPHKTRVIDAWHTAMELAKAAKESIKELTPSHLEEQAKEVREKKKGKTRPNKTYVQARVRAWIAQQYPAYSQMFGAAIDQEVEPDDVVKQTWGAPQLVHNRLDKFLKNIGDPDAIGSPLRLDPDEDPLHWNRKKHPLYFTRHEKPEQTDGEKPCEKGTEAFTIRASELRDFETGKWKITQFEQNLMLLQQLKEGKKTKEEICTLKHSTTARVLLHEMLHLGFTLNLLPPGLHGDVVGYREAAENSLVGTGQVVNFSHLGADKGGSSELPDSYAWFGVYAFLNGLDACKGIHWNKNKNAEADSGCTDVWPQDETKPVHSDFTKYKKGQ